MAIAGVEGERVLDAPDRGAVVLEHVAVAERAQQPALATMRPPPTSCAGSFTVAPASVTSASFASRSGTCQ